MPFTNPLEKMSQHYEALLESGQMSDVVLVAGEKELKVHKLILSARSPVFAAMFAHSTTKEAQENRVVIVDVDVEVLKLLIKYIYTGKVGWLEWFEAAELWLAADKYQLERLKLICKKRLLSRLITHESVWELLIFADMYAATELNTDDLKYKCFDYIIRKNIEVIPSEGWKKISVRADLMAMLYEYLHLKHSTLKNDHRSVYDRLNSRINSYYDFYQKKVVESKKEVVDSVIYLTLEPELDFENLLSYSEVIYSKEEMPDAILVVGNNEFKVNKQVLLARSPVFSAIFAHDYTTEKQKIRVQITDVNVKVLMYLIKYIYTGKIVGSERFAAADLLFAANKFQLDCFKSICEQKLLSQISTESVSDLLILADIHQVNELYTKCLDYLTNNITQVKATDGWKTIVDKVDLFAKICERLNWNFSELSSPITTESVSNLLILADMYQVTELINKCLDYITENVTEVMQQEDWKKIVVRGDLVAKLFEHFSLKH